VLLGCYSIFYANAGESLIDQCLELALIYKCDPYTFLDKTEEEIAVLTHYTELRLRRMKDG
jgi:hypothetical protein